MCTGTVRPLLSPTYSLCHVRTEVYFLSTLLPTSLCDIWWVVTFLRVVAIPPQELVSTGSLNRTEGSLSDGTVRVVGVGNGTTSDTLRTGGMSVPLPNVSRRRPEDQLLQGGRTSRRSEYEYRRCDLLRYSRNGPVEDDRRSRIKFTVKESLRLGLEPQRVRGDDR